MFITAVNVLNAAVTKLALVKSYGIMFFANKTPKSFNSLQFQWSAITVPHPFFNKWFQYSILWSSFEINPDITNVIILEFAVSSDNTSKYKFSGG